MRRIENLKIGELFGTWKVVSLIDSKKHLYKCKCVDCGNEKEYNKYILRYNKYGLCKACNPKIVRNLSKIKIHWNSELNKTPFTKVQDFNPGKRYWFICNNNHNFKSTLKDFSLKNCCSCRDKLSGSQDKDLFFASTKSLCSDLFDHIETFDYNIKIPSIKALIVFSDEDKDSAFKKYYKSEIDYLKAVEKQENIITSFEQEGYTVYEIFIVNNYQKNIDTISRLMVKLNT